MHALRILILSRKFEIYSTRRLVEESRALGAEPLLWDPEWSVSRFQSSFNALIPRLGSFHFSEALHSLERFEHPSFVNRGKKPILLNSSEAYRRARNKWTSYLIFQEHQLPAPPSELVSEGNSPTKWTSFPCILKDLELSKGEGVFLAQNAADLQRLTQDRVKPYLIQKAFPECFGEDLRVFVVGGKIVACMKRKNLHDFRSNLALGGEAEPTILSSVEEDLALRATSALDLQIAGVDILRTHKGSMLLEANPCPGLEGIEKVTRVNVARAIINHVKELHGFRSTAS